MVLDSYRSRFDGLLTQVSRPFLRFSPNTLSVVSLIFAALTGLFYYLGNYFLLLGFVTLVISSSLDAIDGKVARMKNISSKKGDLVDHVFDRYSDLFILLGMTLSFYGNVTLGLFAIIGVMLTSYMGTQAQALGLKRNYSGILGRADRLVLIMIFMLLQFFIPGSLSFAAFKLNVTILLLFWFAIAGNITAIKRIVDSYRGL